MRFAVDIDYAPEKMEASRTRLRAWDRFTYVDRVPVSYCLAPRFFTPLFGINYQDFFESAETQYYWQLQFAKYRIENIPEDFCLSTEIAVHPYFDNVIPASAFGAEIHYPDNETLQAVPVMQSVDDIDRLETPEPDAGLWGTVLEWWQTMAGLAEQTAVTFNGKTAGRVVVRPLGFSTMGPHMVAIDLAGEHFYLWMAEHPAESHELLRKITNGLVNAEEHCRKVDPRPRAGFALAEDSIQICSPSMYEEFCMPYDAVLYDRFGSGLPNGRGMHMCGDSNHLLESLVQKAAITSFNVFGYAVAPKTAAETMGGKVRLWGNINPMLLRNESVHGVKKAAFEALQAMAPCGGFMLGDGANICPGTPLKNLEAMMEASCEYGLPEGFASP
jgi:uroporphyrinogen-III decarboxylase